jgi:signal transduction histidine kinase
VTVGTVGTSVDVAVHDDGPGVPAGMEDAIFERFVSGERSGGAGLGLAIARGLLDREGGGVEHRGGAFHLWVPAARVERAARAATRVERDVGVQAASS